MPSTSTSGTGGLPEAGGAELGQLAHREVDALVEVERGQPGDEVDALAVGGLYGLGQGHELDALDLDVLAEAAVGVDVEGEAVVLPDHLVDEAADRGHDIIHLRAGRVV